MCFFGPNIRMLVVCAALFPAGFLIGCAGGENWAFPFDSAVVEYDISGDFVGRERLYIKGEMEAREAVVVTTIGGEKLPVQSRIVNVGPKVYYYLGDGVKQEEEENVHYLPMKEMSKEDLGYYYLTEVLLDGAIFNRVGKDMVLGRECDVYRVEFGSVCVWNNLVLKKEFSLMGVTTKMVARELRLDVAVSSDVFRVD